MKKILCFVIILGLSISYVPAFAGGFSDISGHWAEQDILALTQKGIIKGVNDTEFVPGAEMTRAQLVAIYNRAFPEAVSSNDITPKENFTDVNTTDWYYNDVVRAINSKFVKGMGNDTFGSNLPILRQDACVLLHRYIGDKLQNSQTDSNFVTDYYAISEYAKEAVLLIKTNNIINGYSDGSFAPHDTITRAEAATILNRTLDKVTLPSDRPSNYKITIDDIYDRLDGSTVTEPLSQAVADDCIHLFLGAVPTWAIVNHNQTDNAIKNVIDGNKDLALVTYPSQENLDYAKLKGVALAIIPVVNDAFVFMTNNDNSIENLTQDQIRKIYNAEITNWSELGGKDEDIMPYQRNTDSGSQSGMLAFMGDTLISVPFSDGQIVGAMGQLMDRVNDTPNSIGYSYLYYVNTMMEYYRSNIKLLSVDGIFPSNENIKSGAYPIITPYYAVYRVDCALDSFPRAMVEYLLSERGQNVAEEAGYVALGAIPELPMPGSYVREIPKKFTIEDIYTKLRVEDWGGINNFTLAVVRELYDDNVAYGMVRSGSAGLKFSTFMSGGFDIALRSELPSAEELAFAAEKDVELEITPIIGDKYGFIVHKDNPVNSLTREQIEKIYSGEITNWREVGGNDGNILIVNNESDNDFWGGYLGDGASDYQRTEEFFKTFFSSLPSKTPVPRWAAIANGMFFDYVDTMTENPSIIGHSLHSAEDLESYKFLEITDWQMDFQYYAITKKAEDPNSFSRNFIQHLRSEEIQSLAEQIGAQIHTAHRGLQRRLRFEKYFCQCQIIDIFVKLYSAV